MAWALIVAANARVIVNNLVQELTMKGAVIVFFNMDELIIRKNSVSMEFLKQNQPKYKKKYINEDYLRQIKDRQWDLIYKRKTSEIDKKKGYHGIKTIYFRQEICL